MVHHGPEQGLGTVSSLAIAHRREIKFGRARRLIFWFTTRHRGLGRRADSASYANFRLRKLRTTPSVVEPKFFSLLLVQTRRVVPALLIRLQIYPSALPTKSVEPVGRPHVNVEGPHLRSG